jgi:hypothetical protein
MTVSDYQERESEEGKLIIQEAAAQELEREGVQATGRSFHQRIDERP